MIQTYIVLNDDEITQIYETADGIEGAQASMVNENLTGTLIEVETPFEGNKGQKKGEFKDWKLLPIKERVEKGFVTIDPMEIIDEKTGEIRKKTLKEQIDTNVKELLPYQKYDESKNEIVIMPWTERIEKGVSTLDDWLNEVIRPERDHLLNETDRVYCNPERWWSYSDEEKVKWSMYKKALKDFPATITKIVDDVTEIEWPKKP
ncbi:MAG: phage tail assembly chaperone [Vulcanibacillus sp.]